MSNFLTVEDVNTTLFNNQGFWWHTIDTSLVDPNGDNEFTDIKYDFCTITKGQHPQFSDEWLYTVIVDNSLFAGGVTRKSSFVKVFGPDVTGNKVTMRIGKGSPPLVFSLYMGFMRISSVYSNSVRILVNDEISLNLKELKNPQEIPVKDNYSGGIYYLSRLLNIGYNEIIYRNMPCGYLLVNLLKTDFKFNCSQELIIGEINKVLLGADNDYLPNGDLVGEYTPTISVKYNNKILPVYYDENINDYCFDLDLTDKIEPSQISFDVIVESNKVLNSSTTILKLNTDYKTVNSFQELKSAIDKVNIIRIGENIIFNTDLIINSDVKIIGNDSTIFFDLEDKYSIIISGNRNVLIDSLSIIGGNPAIIQEKNSNLKLNNFICFTGMNSRFEGLGNCIYALENSQTTLTNCEMFEGNNCICHRGELLIDNLKFNKTFWYDDCDFDNASFLYQITGESVIRNSFFDISNPSLSEFCKNKKSVGFSQCLVMCGEDAVINGATHQELQADNSLPFFGGIYQNESHIFLKYYYAPIDGCVYSQPIINNGKSCCHCVSGVDWVFKDNMEVIRANEE